MIRKGYGLFMSKKKKPDLKHLEPEEQLKYEIAEELGLLDKVLADGWKGFWIKCLRMAGNLFLPRRPDESAG